MREDRVLGQSNETWAVVLAGGEGTRLRQITTTAEGLVIPKQYCSVSRSSCLLQDAMIRAGSVVSPSHVCTVVAAQHRRWWSSAAAAVNESNIFVQPQNKGTAVGILLALLTLERRNPDATVILLPADHYFRDEEAIIRALRLAGDLATADRSCPYLLGADPECPDTELGYILPAARIGDTAAPIAGFTEKPARDFANELISFGALWNLFILAGSLTALLQLFEEDRTDAIPRMRDALERRAVGDEQALERLYTELKPIDFSRDILEIQASRLQVIRVQQCGWTDLGTPKRVEATLRSLTAPAGIALEPKPRNAALFFDLSSQYS